MIKVFCTLRTFWSSEEFSRHCRIVGGISSLLFCFSRKKKNIDVSEKGQKQNLGTCPRRLLISQVYSKALEKASNSFLPLVSTFLLVRNTNTKRNFFSVTKKIESESIY